MSLSSRSIFFKFIRSLLVCLWALVASRSTIAYPYDSSISIREGLLHAEEHELSGNGRQIREREPLHSHQLVRDHQYRDSLQQSQRHINGQHREWPSRSSMLMSNTDYDTNRGINDGRDRGQETGDGDASLRQRNDQYRYVSTEFQKQQEQTISRKRLTSAPLMSVPSADDRQRDSSSFSLSSQLMDDHDNDDHQYQTSSRLNKRPMRPISAVGQQHEELTSPRRSHHDNEDQQHQQVVRGHRYRQEGSTRYLAPEDKDDNDHQYGVGDVGSRVKQPPQQQPREHIIKVELEDNLQGARSKFSDRYHREGQREADHYQQWAPPQRSSVVASGPMTTATATPESSARNSERDDYQHQRDHHRERQFTTSNNEQGRAYENDEKPSRVQTSDRLERLAEREPVEQDDLRVLDIHVTVKPQDTRDHDDDNNKEEDEEEGDKYERLRTSGRRRYKRYASPETSEATESSTSTEDSLLSIDTFVVTESDSMEQDTTTGAIPKPSLSDLGERRIDTSATDDMALEDNTTNNNEKEVNNKLISSDKLQTKYNNINMTNINEIYKSTKPEEEVVEIWQKFDGKLKKGIQSIVGSIVPFALDMSRETKINSNCSGAILKWILGMNQLKSWSLRSKSQSFED